MTRPTITIDPAFDLNEAGCRNTPAACESFLRAYQRAAMWLGFTAVAGHYHPIHAGTYTDCELEIRQDLWQAAHDALKETAPGRWTVNVRAADLRRQGADIVRNAVMRQPQHARLETKRP